jgi:hypothetical protein
MKKAIIRKLFVRIALLSYLTMNCIMSAQPKGYNYEESKVPQFELPPLLQTDDLIKINTLKEWQNIRRPEILNHLKNEIYGKNILPLEQIKIKSEVIEQGDFKLGIRKQIKIEFKRGLKKVNLNLTAFFPKHSAKAVPIFVGYNFKGNHTVNFDKNIIVTESWVRSTKGSKNNQASKLDRGIAASRWDLESILARGYGLITAYYGDIDPDYNDGFKNGVHSLLDDNRKPKQNNGGSIDAWAWGLSRIVDYVKTDAVFDGSKIIVIGHSRLGKSALWAGALDDRIAMVISNNSGCGGAAISRRRFGETIKRINTSFPHWFCENYKKYNDNEDACAVDQHSLLSLIAPRPLYVASASEDLWADPLGEFMSLCAVEPVYKLYGYNWDDTWNWRTKKMPKPDQPLLGRMSYHLRSGKHDITSYDWARYLDFADYNFTKAN